MHSDKTHAVYWGLKRDSGFEGFRGSQEKGLRDSGIKNKAVAKSRFKFQALAICAALMTFATTGWGQISISPGNSASENFNSLGTSTTATLPTNWKAAKSTSVTTPSSYASAVAAVELAGGNSMSSTAGNGIYRFNANDSTSESAIGGLSSSSASKSVFVYAYYQNTGASSIPSLTISYDVERYRNGSNAAGFAVTLYYSTDGSTWTACGSSFVTSFSANADNNGISTAPGETKSVTSQTYTPASAIAASGSFYLAWRYAVASGTTTSNAQALGIDNVVVTAPSAATPTITASGTLAAVNTTYGTASASPTSFTVSGANMNTGITVTPPPGFEVSQTAGGASGYAGSGNPITVGSSGTIANTTVYVRLAANAPVGAYSGNIVLSSTSASNVNVATVSSTVTAKGLTITGASAANRAYNGSTTVAVSGGALVGVLSADTANVSLSSASATGTVTSAAVGDGKAVTVTGYSISGASSGNYTLTQPTGLTVNITQKALTISGASATNRAYNASTTVAVSGGSLVGVESGDTVTLGGSPTGTVATAAVGDGKSVTVTGYSISGAASANYSLTQPTGVTVNITKANQTITFDSLAPKNFGDANFALSATANSSLTVSYSSSNTNVATVAGNTVTVGRAGTTTITASQAGDSNYNAATSVPQTLTVNAVAPGAPTLGTITAGDGQLSVVFTAPASDGGASITNYQVSTNNGSSYAALSPAQVTSPLIISGLSNGTEYTVLIKAVNSAGAGAASGSGSGTPVAASVPTIVTSTTVNGALSTTYGTDSSTATFTVSGSALNGDLTVTPPAGFQVSTNSSTGFGGTATLTQSGGTLGSTTVYVRLAATSAVGSYSGNIVVSGGGATSQTVATIPSTVSAKGLTITGLTGSASKVYDRSASIGFSGTPSYSGLANGESFAVVGTGSASFANANVGTSKVATITGYSAPSSNYSLSDPTFSADITAKGLTVTGTSAANKVYDATTTATLSGATLSGVVAGDSVSLTGGTSGTFATAAVGTGKSVSTTMGITGTDSGNYTISQPTGITADITVKALTITGISISNKVYDGNTTATISGTAAYSGLVGGESFSVTGTATAIFGDKTKGTNKSVTVSGYTAPSANYSITQPSGLTADITAKALTITGVTASNKVYDGSTTAALNTGSAALLGVVGDDTVSLNSVSATGLFADKNVALGKAVTTSGFSLSGADSGNYSLTQPSTTADITALGLTVTGASVTSKVYDGTATATITGAALSGVVGSDAVTLTGGTSGTFVSRNVGTGISVTTSMGISGAGSANYTLTAQPTLTGTITQAAALITFGALPAGKKVGDAAFSAGATTTLGTISYSSSNTAVATVNASTGSITLVAPGVTTITATVAGEANFTGATASQTLKVGAALSFIAGWDFQTTTTGGTVITAAPGTTNVFSANFGSGTIYLDGSNGSSSWSSPSSNPELTGFAGTAVNGGNGFSTSTTAPAALAIANTSANGKKIVFKFSMTGKANLSVSYAAQRTSTGFTSHVWETSTDGVNWSAVETNSTIASSFATVSLATITVLDGAANAYLRLTVSGATSATGNNRLDNIQFNASALPTITPSGSFAAVSTTYGTASAASGTTATVTGGSLTADIIATAPEGFEVSNDGATYGATATFAQTSGFANGTLYLRLAANAAAGSYNSQVVTLSSTGASNQAVAIATSTVSQKALTVSNLGAITKVYDGGNSATFTGDLVGVVGADVVSLVGTGTYASVNVGTGINVTSTATLTGAAAGNYSLTQPTGLTGAITVKALTIGAPTIASKVFDGTTTAGAVTVGSLSGFVTGETVTATGAAAAYSSANLGTYSGVTVTYTLANGTGGGLASNYSLANGTATGVVTAASLSSGDITITPVGDGSFTASATGVSGFSISYSGRTESGVTTSYGPSPSCPHVPGFYTVTATSTDGNYSGSGSSNYYIAGPVAVNDAITKPAGNPSLVLTLASLLVNDVRITPEGVVATDGMSITGVINGSGNSAEIDGGDILFTPGGSSPETFTYVLSYGSQTAIGTVTVTTESSAPTFALQIAKVGTATYSAPNTTVTHDFIGVPNQTYALEYTTDLNGTWTRAGDPSTGATGSFSVTITESGDVAADWNAHMFFRARLVR